MKKSTFWFEVLPVAALILIGGYSVGYAWGYGMAETKPPECPTVNDKQANITVVSKGEYRCIWTSGYAQVSKELAVEPKGRK